jgi:putative hydrolases of HD superfamily
MTNLEKKIKFVAETDKLKAVYRRALVKCDNNRRENTAEHSWQVTLMAVILEEFCNQSLDITKVMKMLLIHDIVEIYAGDTYAFDDHAVLAEQTNKELKALKKIFSLLPDSEAREYKNLWLEFEDNKTPEAKFSKAIERAIPVFQNMENDGGSWTAYGKVPREKVLNRNKELKDIAPELYDYLIKQINIAVKKGWLI